eukprot:283897_1
MFMCRISSGRQGYEYFGIDINDDKNQLNISRETLILMLQYENELRLSNKWVSLMEKEILESNDKEPSALDGYMTDKISVTINNLQTEVVKKFGFNKSENEINNAIKILRSSLSLYPNDIQVKNAANYLKYNKIKKGSFKIGDKINCDEIKVLKINNNDVKNDIDDEKKQEYNPVTS